jgi:hypothetical protein
MFSDGSCGFSGSFSFLSLEQAKRATTSKNNTIFILSILCKIEKIATSQVAQILVFYINNIGKEVQ